MSIRLLLLVVCTLCFALSSAFVLPTRTAAHAHHRHDAKSTTTHHGKLSPLYLSTEDNTPKESNLPMLLDIGTKGGALFLSLVLFIVPIIFYQIVTNVFGVDGIEAGKWIGVGFTAFTTILWVSTYIFRVATKDMTYVRRFIYIVVVVDRMLKPRLSLAVLLFYLTRRLSN